MSAGYDAFRKIFGFKICESVQEFCRAEMSFEYLYYVSTWNFIVSVSDINNACLSTICHLTRLSLCKGDEFYCHGHNFGSMNCSRYFKVKIIISVGYAYYSVYRTLIPLFVTTKDTMGVSWISSDHF